MSGDGVNPTTTKTDETHGQSGGDSRGTGLGLGEVTQKVTVDDGRRVEQGTISVESN